MAAEPKGHPTEELPPVVQNRGLFSDYYLTELVRDDDFFQASAKDVEAIWRAIKILYEKVKGQLATANEAQTEQLIIHPVLDLLGWRDLYAVQPPVPSADGPRRPDFAFFGSLDDKEHAEATCKGKVEYFAKALAIGDAKQWDRSLDRKRKGAWDAFTNANPSYQIDFYLRATDRTWGILTNGRRWRLYHRDTSYRMNVFYEVDLVALLEEYDESFLYFYAFFHKDAFTTGFLDRVLRGSRDYAGKLGDELKENVYEALRLLAEGLLRCPENGLREDDLDEVRANTFVLIYRLLFLFYAEDRGLLPMENPHYRTSYSLRGWAQEIADKLEGGHSFSPTTYGSWMKLSELCRIVNEGDSHLRVPPYNGGLFDVAKHLLLVRCKIGDLYLASAVDRLARAEAAGRTGRGPVSYRDLDIRHIGSIYEGLLEHHLRVAEGDIAVVKDKGREVFVPVAKLGNMRLLKTHRAGEVYLETDKGERKATGSYYTPDYVVKYIVEHTLGPLVEEKHKKIEEERHVLEEKVKGSRGYDREVYERKLAEIGNRLIEEILSIKVLDPAMGSGHFLVEAVDFLARALLEALGGAPEDSDEEDIRWARREVVERCIFGVDVNPLAVELAKLSLWISTVAKDRPLSFLDHHLRLGNSLIGARVTNLGILRGRREERKPIADEATPSGLFEGKLKERLPVVLGEVVELLRKPSESVADIREKEQLYDHILTLLQPFKHVADVWTSAYFGGGVGVGDYATLLDRLSGQPAAWGSALCSQPWFKQVQHMAEERVFFHWELEFPEVFFAETGQRKRNPGFDAVVSNPPYVRQEQFRENKEFFKEAFQVYDGVADLYIYFYEIAHRVLRGAGRFGMITSNKFMRAAYGRKLRRFLTQGVHPIEIIDFGDLPVFPDVSAYPCIVLTVKGVRDTEKTRYLRVPSLEFDSLAQLVAERSSPLPSEALAEDGWRLAEGSALDILRKMEAASVPLKAWLRDAKINYGIKSGCNEAFFIDEETRAWLIGDDPKGAELIKPLVVGEDIKRYEIEFEGRYLIFTRRGVDIDRYPAIKHRLEHFRERLEPRPPDWDEETQGKWPGRKPGAYQWYEIQDTIDYYEDFEKPKIIYQEIATSQAFAFDRTNLLCNNKCFIVPSDDPYLIALLNSRVIWSYLTSRVSKLRGDTFALQSIYVELVPIRRIAFVTPPAERARLVEEGKRLYREALERGRHGNGLEGYRKEGSE